MGTYRVDVGGKTVWSQDVTEGEGVLDVVPAEHLERPDAGQPAKYIYLDDELIGVQASYDDEGSAPPQEES